MRWSRWLLLLVVSLVPLLAACGKKQECDICENDSECDAGLSCEAFTLTNGGKRFACASFSTLTCSFPQ